jgi:hypothetical protein
LPLQQSQPPPLPRLNNRPRVRSRTISRVRTIPSEETSRELQHELELRRRHRGGLTDRRWELTPRGSRSTNRFPARAGRRA